MIGMVTGAARDAGKGTLVIRTEGGVGYIIRVPEKTKSVVLEKKTCTLFTHTAIKKDTMELFGFLNQEEHAAFLLLLTVSGIGPKKALAILEAVPAQTLLSAIRDENAETLASFGIPKKQIQRMIMDLQKKIEVEGNGIPEEVIMALIALGYDKKEITDALKNTRITETETAKQIQEALRAMRPPEKNNNGILKTA